MPGMSSKHSINVKHDYYYCYFQFHIITWMLSKLISLEEGSNKLSELFLVFQALSEVDSCSHRNKHIVGSWNMGPMVEE